MIVLGTAQWFGEIVSILRLPGSGTVSVAGIRAYWDADLKEEASQISWGACEVGVPKNITLHLHSISNTPVGLDIETGNWTFFDSGGNVVFGPVDSVSFVEASWDYYGEIIPPEDNVTVIFTLLVSPQADIDFIVSKGINGFLFDISIVASEQLVSSNTGAK